MSDSQKLIQLPAALGHSDDGYILLDENAVIIAASDEAGRMLSVDATSMISQPLSQLVEQGSAKLQSILTGVEIGGRSDISISILGGRKLLVSLRKDANASHISLIQLCDLDGLNYRRTRATGERNLVANGFLTTNHTRPDFEAQRRLSPELHRMLSRGERAIQQGARILITGETGVGKTEVARFLHTSVSDATDPFVVVNCATSSAEDLNAQMFGSNIDQSGLVEQALGGTLFLDEVAELPASVQTRLVGYLEDSSRGIKGYEASALPNLRVISTTNANLQEKVIVGKFRADLFYRLSVIKIDVPPLRLMPALIDHLTNRFQVTINQRRANPAIIPERLREILNDYSFPGNIRELLNIVQKATIFMEDAEDMEELIGELIETKTFDQGDLSPATLDLKTEVRRFERDLIDRAIRVHGSKRKAANALGVDIGTISRKTTAKKADGNKSNQLDVPKQTVQKE